MSFVHALAAFLFVFGSVATVFLAWVSVRWVQRRWPSGPEVVAAGPFASAPATAGTVPDNLRDKLVALEQEQAKLATALQLIRQEWDDAYSKMRRVEERVRKRQQRAGADDDDDGELPFPLPPATAPEPPPPPPLSPAMERFNRKYGA